MALNLEAVGQKIGPLTTDYTWKDVVLYALGVGAGSEELEYVYEKDLRVLPSFAIAAIFDFLFEAGARANVNLAGILHGEQELVFHRPIPAQGTLVTEGEIKQAYDLGRDKGAVIVAEGVTRDGKGRKLFTNSMSIFARLDGGFGGEKPPKRRVEIPDRKPDWVVDDQPSRDQPLLYRLSGDTFDLHVDPEFARNAGFDQPIMHGLCTHGYGCRACIRSLVPGEPEKVRRISCRFSRPLYPGVPIQTRIWNVAPGRAVWRVVNAQTQEVVIDQGEFEFGELEDRVLFTDQVAIVTGAGGGLGRAYALELAARGARVVVNDFGGARDGSGPGSASPAQQVVQEIEEAGGQAVANTDNVATAEGGRSIVQAALDRFGRVDVLINNAGILRDKTFHKLDPADWHAVVDVHLNGTFHVTRAAFPVMKEQGYGRVIMTTSAAGLYGNFGQSNYSAAKLGLVGLMNSLKLEGERFDFKVNTVAPLAASRLTEDVFPKELLDKARPEFVVPMVLYLASRDCPVNGEIYNAGMGTFNRVALATGKGRVLASDGRVPEPEEVRDSMSAIVDLTERRIFASLNEQVTDLVTRVSAPEDEQEKADQRPGFTEPSQVFEAMPARFQPREAGGVDVVFEFRIKGGMGGVWQVDVKNETCEVTAGEPSSPTTTLSISDHDFLDMMNGQLPAMKAYTRGKLKISGDVMKSQLIERLFQF
jgi:NAD(P)-dependent dehydrogenase (short-subunit alcohol dehydrogenase family)/putative sterol carrier protein